MALPVKPRPPPLNGRVLQNQVQIDYDDENDDFYDDNGDNFDDYGDQNYPKKQTNTKTC